MTITSTAFQDGEYIPSKYSRNGEDINPPLTFSEVPVEARSLALIVEDPDVLAQIFTHWILYDMLAGTLQVLEGQVPEDAKQGRNDYGELGYGGPQPPSGTHRYVFKLFALDDMLGLEEGIARSELYRAMEGRVLDAAELTGLYSA